MQSVEAFYDLASGYHASQLAVTERAFHLLSQERARKIQPWISPTDRVFEYGVGTGLNLARLKCAERAGWDIAQHLTHQVECRGVRWMPMDDVPDRQFDAVVCHHVLEHATNPDDVLRRVRRLLGRRGLLLLYVPYERERKYRRFRADEPNHHLFSWNPQTLGNLVTAAGFQLESSTLGTYGYERFAAERLHRWPSVVYRLALKVLRYISPVHEVRVVARKAE